MVYLFSVSYSNCDGVWHCIHVNMKLVVREMECWWGDLKTIFIFIFISICSKNIEFIGKMLIFKNIGPISIRRKDIFDSKVLSSFEEEKNHKYLFDRHVLIFSGQDNLIHSFHSRCKSDHRTCDIELQNQFKCKTKCSDPRTKNRISNIENHSYRERGKCIHIKCA